MNNDVDIIKFTTSIIMGTTSVVLGIFAIWLSNKFNNNSSSALEKIKELSNEIKILSQNHLSNQRDFTDKMLDSILDSNGKNGQGLEYEELEDIFNKEIKKTEEKIMTALRKEISNDDNNNDNKIDNLENEVKDVTKEASNTMSAYLTVRKNLKKMLYNLINDSPSYLVLLSIIIAEEVRSVEELNDLENKFNIYYPYKKQINKLIKMNILKGNENNFEINPDYEQQINNIVSNNLNIIKKLIRLYGDQPRNMAEAKTLSNIEKTIAKNINI